MDSIVLIRDLHATFARHELAARVTAYDTVMARAAAQDD
jgi:hypothetical protein